MLLCELKNVTKTYSVGEEVTPVKDLCFKIYSGDFVAIKGESGIGKSTLLFLIGGLLKATEGEIVYRNQAISKLTDSQCSLWRRNKIGYLFQDSQLIQALTVKENILMAGRFGTGGKIKDKEADKILEKLGVDDKKNSMPYQLSGGQRRRVMIAAVLAKKPELILADEPTNDLDERWSDRIMELLMDETKNGGAVVLVTHDEKSASYAEKIYCLEDGKLNLQQ